MTGLFAAATTADPRATEHSREGPAIAALRRCGYGAVFRVEGAGLRAVGGRLFRPGEVEIRDYFRFEGTSDPDDAAVVYALEASDGTRGMLVDAYGSYADPGVAAILDQLRVRRPGEPRGGGWARWAALGLGVTLLAASAVLLTSRPAR
jgi:hypothetical protein